MVLEAENKIKYVKNYSTDLSILSTSKLVCKIFLKLLEALTMFVKKHQYTDSSLKFSLTSENISVLRNEYQTII